jgi:hypothetical protein
MTMVVELPPGLAGMPAGPELDAALDAIDPAHLCHEDALIVLEADDRQDGRKLSRKFAALCAVGRFGPGPDGHLRRLPHPSQWADGEIAACLSWSERKAARELCLAESVVTDLPLVYAALWAGRLDRDKAWVFAEYLHDLPGELRTMICTALVAPAAGWTAGKLANRLRRMILEAEPEWAARRYRAAIRQRGVTAYPDQDGTMVITGHGLAPDEAAAAMARIDELAVEIRRAGHPSLLPQIRADLYVGPLDGSLQHLDRARITTAMLGRVRPDDTEPIPPATTTDTAEDQTSGDQAGGVQGGGVQGGEGIDLAGGGAGGGSQATGTDPDAGPADQTTPTGEAAADPLADPDPSDPDTDDLDTDPHSEVEVEVEPVAGVEIRVALATLLGLDERCGQLGGFDYVLPELARRRVARQRRGARWRFAVTDTDGRVVFGGLTRKRPLLPAGQPPGTCRGGIVELYISVELLAALTGGGPGAPPAGLSRWAPVLGDIAAQYADRARLLAQLDARPGDRFPSIGLSRFLCIRDRTCVAPGCRRSATTCQIDHTRDYAEGGPTTLANTAPLCPSHHHRKTAGAWKLRQTRPGVFEWISPLGRVYRTQAEPLDPPPPMSMPPTNDPDPPPF